MNKKCKQVSCEIATIKLRTGEIIRGEIIENAEYEVSVVVNGATHSIDVEDIARMIVEDPISSAFDVKGGFKITWIDEGDMTNRCAGFGDIIELIADEEYYFGAVAELTSDEIHLQIKSGDIMSLEYDNIEGIRVLK